MSTAIQLYCACGRVHLEAEKAPIVSVACMCNSCREAGARLEKLPEAASILERDGGTRFVLYRKDRVRFTKGAELLREFRLTPTSKTRRVVASCCNTPVFAEFQNGHWLSLYGGLWPKATLPALEMRTMTSDLADPSVLSDDVPNSSRQSGMFFAKLLGAWIAMGFRVPKIAVAGEIKA